VLQAMTVTWNTRNFKPEFLVEWKALPMSLEPFDSRAKALPAERRAKGYGDEIESRTVSEILFPNLHPPQKRLSNSTFQ